MDGAVMAGKSDFQADATIQNASTTQFIQAAPVVEGNSSSTATTSTIYDETLVTIKDFLAKPVLVQAGTWTTSQPINTQLYTGAISTLLLGNHIWADKIRGFNLMKADCIVTVQINASPFQQGKLILNYLPNVNDFSAINPNWYKLHNNVLSQKVQTPHVDLDCRRTSAAIRIPYIAPSTLHAFDLAKYEWAYFWLNVYSVLQTGPSAAPSGLGVDYLVYVHFENVELIAPIVPQMSMQAVRRNVVSETKENSGPISSGLRTLGRAVNVLGDIPILSRFTGPVEWAVNAAAGIASIFGWSKPRELRGTTVVANQLVRYAGTCDGPDLAIPGAISCYNRLQTIDYGSYTNEDEMTFPFLLSIPWYDGEFSWASTAVSGTQLYAKNINPRLMYTSGTDIVGSATAIFAYNSTYSLLGNTFNYWRGGFIITLKFIKTQMHTGRIQVAWTPSTKPSATVPDDITGSFSLRAIIDIRTEDEISFELPYLVYSDYLQMWDGINPQEALSGVVTVNVLNELKGPESVSQTMQVQVFYKGAADFEFAVPTTGNLGYVPYVPQMDTKEIILHGETKFLDLPPTVIGNAKVSHNPLFNATRCIGEKIMSIKQMMLKNMVIVGFNSAYNPKVNAVLIDPNFIGACTMNSVSGTLGSSNVGGDLYSLFACMFAYRRGSVKIMCQDNVASASSNQRIYSTVVTNATNPNLPTGFQFSQPFLDWTSVPLAISNAIPNYNAQVYNSSGNNIWQLSSMNVLDNNMVSYNHVPYYNRFPLSLNVYYDGTAIPAAEVSYPDAYLALFTSETFDFPLYQRAVGDDFQFAFFLGAPPTIISYTVA